MSKIKICGLKRECDIDYVNEAKPDYIGFVFAKSKRQVSHEMAAKLSAKLDKSITPVGVFVNAPIEEIISLYSEGIIHMAQLHGQENSTYIKQLRSQTDCPLIKALKIDKDFDTSILPTFDVDYFLFDNGAGGTGKTFDWSLMPQTKKPFFLAGGLTIQNIEAAIAYYPFAIDLSSGVETNGLKDRKKILEIISKIRTIGE
ncbi:MAG: phosphoribosylanthranilate isomerase [Lachnospiraceae bacterium]